VTQAFIYVVLLVILPLLRGVIASERLYRELVPEANTRREPVIRSYLARGIRLVIIGDACSLVSEGTAIAELRDLVHSLSRADRRHVHPASLR